MSQETHAPRPRSPSCLSILISLPLFRRTRKWRVHGLILIWACALHHHLMHNTDLRQDPLPLRLSALSISPGGALVSTTCLLTGPSLLSPLASSLRLRRWIRQHSTIPQFQPTFRVFPNVQQSLQRIGPTGCTTNKKSNILDPITLQPLVTFPAWGARMWT